MTPEQIRRVLTLVAAAEGRVMDESHVALWTVTLAVHDVTEDEFREAVVRHYAESTYPIRPGHVWAMVRGWRAIAAVDERIDRTESRHLHDRLLSEALATDDWTAFDEQFPGERDNGNRIAAQWFVDTGRPVPEALTRFLTD